MKKVNGITMVSLVVTIIVLIILAGVSITSILGENGIITIARQAKENVELSRIEEQTKLNELYTQITIEETDLGSAELKVVLEKISNLEQTVNQQQERITQLESETKTIDDIYPVGSIYMTTDIYSAEEMSSKFGGTWENYAQGRTVIGAGTGTDSNSENKIFVANETGGEYNHKLSVEELASHTHIQNKHKHECKIPLGGYSGWPKVTDHYGYVFDISKPFLNSNMALYSGTFAESSVSNSTDTIATNQNTGGDKAHNNIQPYIVTYMWKRVA